MTRIQTNLPTEISEASTTLSQVFSTVALVLSAVIVLASFSALAGLAGIA
jgi:hypothetical protein